MPKAKVTLENYKSYSYDGGSWCLSPVKLELDGKVLEEPDGKGGVDWKDPFYVKAGELLGGEFRHSLYVAYYNDNPSVHGVPDPTVTVGGVELRVADLVDCCADDGEDPRHVEVEVEAPEGFTL
jgi:hypothetical protein